MIMEPIGAFPDGEWDFSRMFSAEYQFDFTPELVGGLHFSNPSAFFPNSEANVNMDSVNENLFYPWNSLNPDLHFASQENSSSSDCSSSVLFPSSSHETYFLSHDSNHIPATNEDSMSMDFCIMDEKILHSFVPMFPDIPMQQTVSIDESMNNDEMGNFDNSQLGGNAAPDKGLQLKRKHDAPESELNPPGKRKSQVARDAQVKRRKNVKSKKNQQCTPNSNADEERNAGPDGQSSSSCSSEDDNASQDSNGGATSDSKVSGALNSNGKTRASRGSATDPQSLYARKRRERINERLRILQNLVPNGTKVDISTMLEEAVHYVKFLQLQIKLLSSDDLWMYAPIAYNGMDIGLNQKIATLL